MIPKSVSEVENCLKQFFLFVKSESIPVLFLFKHLLELIKQNKFKDWINAVNIGLFCSQFLKSPQFIGILQILRNDQQSLRGFLRNIVCFAQKFYEYI